MHRSWQLVLSLWLLTVAQGATTPIVTLLRERSGPAAPAAAQWLTTTVKPSQPFSKMSGAAQSQTASPVRGGRCEDTFDVAVGDVDVNHTRHADLTVRLATLTAAGEEKTSIVIFDGPALAAGKTADEIAAIRIGDLGALPLTWSSTCHTFRLTVTDTGSTAGGQLHSWTLRTRVAWYPFHHDRAYYQALLFGSVFNRPSAANYFREVSRWNQIFTNAGIHGPVAWQRRDWVHAAISELSAVQAMLTLHAEGFRFSDYDTNRDGQVGTDELVILAIDNQEWRGGSLRRAWGECLDMRATAGVEVCSAVVLAGTRVDFATLTHELSHALGTTDLYGDWAKGECRSHFLTLMSCTISKIPDDPRPVYLDPYHRWRLGWVFPIAFGNSSSYELQAEHYNELGHLRDR
ncbi:MAG: hypothetical protein FJW39_33750, partial [Acidobacteria bacterium]|nr:hypothetical protein [Acidobacteriota bacterium]